MRLSALLGNWTAWLALFPAELAGPLGDLLLRLSPLLDPLRRQSGPAALEPAGVGDIVRRGSYERLLASEWAYADAVPDEFIRRAGSGELLFNGPEPAHSEQSLRSVVLFDAGPAQLGEPRLAHLAMFILLARRAELAGAQFQWGLLQRPGVLYDDLGAQGVRRLLDARTLAAPDGAAASAWDEKLDPALADCWAIGDPESACPQAARSQVLVRRVWLEPGLDLALRQRGRSRTLALPLPAPEDCVRLLRRPFDPAGTAPTVRLRSKAHSLKRAPLFSSERGWVAVCMLDGSVTLYHVPDSPHAAPGRARNAGKLPHADAIVAAGAFDKAFGAVAVADGKLHPFGFPGRVFNKIGKATLPLPKRDQFEATPGALRWAQAFFLRHNQDGAVTEQLLVLDKARRLVCWTRGGQAGDPLSTKASFRLVAQHVIGAVQHGNRLLFAVSLPDRTDAYALRHDQTLPEHLYPLMQTGERYLFGDLPNWRGGRGMYAMQLSGARWVVGDAMQSAGIEVGDGCVVLGCARRAPKEAPGLVVLEPARTRIAFYLGGQRVTLVESAERIAQASFDPVKDRLAWLGQKSGTLTVRGIGDAQPLLQTISKENAHA